MPRTTDLAYFRALHQWEIADLTDAALLTARKRVRSAQADLVWSAEGTRSARTLALQTALKDETRRQAEKEAAYLRALLVSSRVCQMHWSVQLGKPYAFRTELKAEPRTFTVDYLRPVRLENTEGGIPFVCSGEHEGKRSHVLLGLEKVVIEPVQTNVISLVNVLKFHRPQED